MSDQEGKDAFDETAEIASGVVLLFHEFYAQQRQAGKDPDYLEALENVHDIIRLLHKQPNTPGRDAHILYRVVRLREVCADFLQFPAKKKAGKA